MSSPLRLVALAAICAISVYAEEVSEATEPEPPKYESPQPSSDALFFENFDDESSFKNKWVLTKADEYDGEWGVSAGNTTVQFAEDLALELKNEAKKHGIAAAIDGGVAAVEGQPLVIQYEVRLENTHSCGGLYIKLLSGDSLDLTKFDGASPYSIMFGPDHCGGTNKVHFILRHKNLKTGEFEEKHAKNPPSAVTSDKKTHLYKLVINADNTYEFFIDQESKGKGNLLDDMQPAINPPKLVDDPSDSKPEDWVDEAKINDPAASKPDDWDEDAPKMILDEEAVIPSEWREDEPDEVADPDAKMPEDWDEEEDGD